MSSPPSNAWLLSCLDDNPVSDHVFQFDFAGGQTSIDPFLECRPDNLEHAECSGGEVNTRGARSSSAAVKRRREPDSQASLTSKANREKRRRDRLNDRFLELSSVLEPGKPPKTDKASILCDAVRVVSQLRVEADRLRAANQQMRESVQELKEEKSELRDEKARLKVDKEQLEEQLKSLIPAGLLSHPSAAAALFAASAGGKRAGAKAQAMPGTGWPWLSPAMLDTSLDHVLRPPAA